MDYVAMGARIRKRRKKCRLTQEGLAEATGISLSFVGHIERGTRTPSIQTIMAIADALDCSVDDLLGRRNACEQTREERLDRIFEEITALVKESANM